MTHTGITSCDCGVRQQQQQGGKNPILFFNVNFHLQLDAESILVAMQQEPELTDQDTQGNKRKQKGFTFAYLFTCST